MASAVLVAGGSGTRMGGGEPKQYRRVGGAPILARTVGVFRAHPRIHAIHLVVPPEDLDYCRRAILGETPREDSSPEIILVPGGKERQDSVFAGLCSAEESCRPEGIVLIHDGVRPLVTADLIDRVIDAALRHGACLPAVPVVETVKRVDGADRVVGTEPRGPLRLAQTPQGFRFSLIRKAHQRARDRGLTGTDDAALVEAMGHPVVVVAGSRWNIKVTTPEDLLMVESVIKGFQSIS